jgi:archaellum component FlaG (FlaF/FlaG flagellin family)
MKGISTILAMILIVIIVVALIGLTYTFAVGLFSSTTQGASTQTQTVTQNMQKSANIIAASCGSLSGSTRTFKFTLKNIGTLTVAAADQTVFQDGVKVTSVTFTDLPSSQVSDEYSFTNITQANAGSHELKISSPAGIFAYPVTCS